MEFPELKDDEIFLNQVDISFNSNQLFEEWKKLANMEKRSSILSSLLGIQSEEGKPYFHIEYLIDKVMKLTPEEKEENKAYWLKSKGLGSATSEGGGEFGGGGGEGGGGEFGGPQTFGEAGSQPQSPQGPPAQGGGENPPAQGGGEEFEF